MKEKLLFDLNITLGFKLNSENSCIKQIKFIFYLNTNTLYVKCIIYNN